MYKIVRPQSKKKWRVRNHLLFSLDIHLVLFSLHRSRNQCKKKLVYFCLFLWTPSVTQQWRRCRMDIFCCCICAVIWETRGSFRISGFSLHIVGEEWQAFSLSLDDKIESILDKLLPCLKLGKNVVVVVARGIFFCRRQRRRLIRVKDQPKKSGIKKMF